MEQEIKELEEQMQDVELQLEATKADILQNTFTASQNVCFVLLRSEVLSLTTSTTSSRSSPDLSEKRKRKRETVRSTLPLTVYATVWPDSGRKEFTPSMNTINRFCTWVFRPSRGTSFGLLVISVTFSQLCHQKTLKKPGSKRSDSSLEIFLKTKPCITSDFRLSRLRNK